VNDAAPTTFAAALTAPAPGAIAVVAIAGADANGIVRRVIKQPKSDAVPSLEINRPRLVRICDSADQTLDDAMRVEDGIGLAAPQVGVLQRLFVCSVPGTDKDGKKRDLVFVNPVLQDFEGEDVAEEGCLSIPDVLVRVRRPTACTITGLDLEGNPIALRGTDLLARCWQHECDHLDGRLITDRMHTLLAVATQRNRNAMSGGRFLMIEAGFVGDALQQRFGLGLHHFGIRVGREFVAALRVGCQRQPALNAKLGAAGVLEFAGIADGHRSVLSNRVLNLRLCWAERQPFASCRVGCTPDAPNAQFKY